MQSVSATVVDESTIDIQCHFIHGSDALGCKVILVSDYQGIKDETIMNVSRNNNIVSIQRRVNLTQLSSCYSKVTAFDIEVNGTISNLAIEGNILPKATTNSPYYACSGMHSLIIFIIVELAWFYYLITDLNRPPYILPIVLTTTSISVLIIAIIIIVMIVIVLKKGMSFHD